MGNSQARLVNCDPFKPEYVEVQQARSPTFIANSPMFLLNPEQSLQQFPRREARLQAGRSIVIIWLHWTPDGGRLEEPRYGLNVAQSSHGRQCRLKCGCPVAQVGAKANYVSITGSKHASGDTAKRCCRQPFCPSQDKLPRGASRGIRPNSCYGLASAGLAWTNIW